MRGPQGRAFFHRFVLIRRSRFSQWLRKPVPRSLSRIRRQRWRVVADDSLPGDTGAESPREQPSRVCALRRQASRLPNAAHNVLSKQIARDLCRKAATKSRARGRGVSPRALLWLLSWASKKGTRCRSTTDKLRRSMSGKSKPTPGRDPAIPAAEGGSPKAPRRGAIKVLRPMSGKSKTARRGGTRRLRRSLSGKSKKKERAQPGPLKNHF